MKFLKIITLIVCAVLSGSCENDSIGPTEYIKGKVDGKMMVYKAKRDDVINNYRFQTSLYLTFYRDTSSYQYWTIAFNFPDPSYLENLKVPFVIKGPGPNFDGSSPEFHTSILDPAGAPYGLPIAGGSTFNDEFTATITYFKNDFIKGTFSGKGYGEFSQGEFAAKLVEMK